MKKINLGGEIPASEIGLGFWRTAGTSESDVEKLISTAVDNGIDFLDTADIYGGGECEKLLGTAVKKLGIRDKVIIETKCGIRKGFFDFSKEHIINSVHNSLKSLETDYIDILLLHRPDTLMEPEEVAEAFEELHNSGLVKHFGVSNETPQQIALLQKYVPYKLIADQIQFGVGHCPIIDFGICFNNMVDASINRDNGILEYCRLNDITIQAWSPLCYGYFEGTFLDNYDKFPELNKKLDELSEKYSVSKTAIAFAWILRHPAKIQALAGTTKAEHLAEICKASDIKLSRQEWYELYVSAGKILP